MTRHEKPSLQMIVRDHKLVPGGAYELEVLDTYQNGAELVVAMHQPRSLPLHKKYWAVLRDLIENTELGDRFGEARYLHNAIKIKLGMIDVGKTFSGQRYISVGSTSFEAMDEAEFRRFYDKAMAILAEVTGIDPKSLRDRYKHIPESEPSGEATPQESPSPGEAASPSPEGAAPEAGGEVEAKGLSAPPPADDSKLKAECISKLLAISTDKDLSKEDAAQNLGEAADLWLGHLGDEHKAFVKAVFDTSRKVLKGELGATAARKYLGSL